MKRKAAERTMFNHHFGPAIWRTSMKIDTDIHDAQRINPNDWNGPLVSPAALPISPIYVSMLTCQTKVVNVVQNMPA